MVTETHADFVTLFDGSETTSRYLCVEPAARPESVTLFVTGFQNGVSMTSVEMGAVASLSR